MRHVIEIFEGVVDAVETEPENTFWAHYEDFDGNEENAEFLTGAFNFSKEELKWLEPGAWFDWIFYNDGTADFKFIIEYWTQEDIDKAQAEAGKLIKLFHPLREAEDDAS